MNSGPFSLPLILLHSIEIGTLVSKDSVEEAYGWANKDVLLAWKHLFGPAIVAFDHVKNLVEYRGLCQSFGYAAIISDLIHIRLSDGEIVICDLALLKYVYLR